MPCLAPAKSSLISSATGYRHAPPSTASTPLPTNLPRSAATCTPIPRSASKRYAPPASLPQPTQWGIEVHRGLGGTGVVRGAQGRGASGKRIGLRARHGRAADGEENTNLKWRSTIPGRFHGCGHDGHTTMLLGAARYLAETRELRRDRAIHFPACRRRPRWRARHGSRTGGLRSSPATRSTACNVPDLNHGEIAILANCGWPCWILRHHHSRLWRAWRDAGALGRTRW